MRWPWPAAAGARPSPDSPSAGDLVAGAIAPESRSRRVGEMAGADMAPRAVEQMLERTAESLATVPLLGLAFEREGIEAPVTTGLSRVLEGEASPEQWLESMRSTPGGRGRRAA